MSEWRKPETSKAQVRAFARRVLRRVHALGGHSASLEDIEQELWLAWCKAVKSYKPESGVPFGAYLRNGMQMHINRYVESQYERFHEQTVAINLDAPAGEDHDAPLSEVIADERIDFAEELEHDQAFEFAIQHLSPRARQFISLLKEQPEELILEFRKLQQRSDYARELGIPCATPQRLASFMVFDLMGSPRSERQEILTEVQQLGEYMIARSYV